jgi:DNA-binding response OmpR family regulator
MDGDLTILIVDDMDGCRELYSEWLDGRATVRTATGKDDGIAQMGHEVDLVILDRDLSGDDGRTVAVEMDEQGYDVHIVMVSWMEADFDIVEYPIDSYVEKPLTEQDFLAIVTQYERQQGYQNALEEYFALSSKLAAIEAHQSSESLASNPEYDRLKEQVEAKRQEVDEAITESTADWNFTFKTCTRALEPVGSDSS